MSRRVILALAAAALVAVGLAASCAQGEGDRCQRDQDCEPLICVGEDGIGGSGHCCPRCTSGSADFRVATLECVCDTGGGTDGDADQDADQPSDAAPDGDGDPDGDPGEADGAADSDAADGDADGGIE